MECETGRMEKRVVKCKLQSALSVYFIIFNISLHITIYLREGISSQQHDIMTYMETSLASGDHPPPLEMFAGKYPNPSVNLGKLWHTHPLLSKKEAFSSICEVIAGLNVYMILTW